MTIRFTEVPSLESGIDDNAGATWGGAWGDIDGNGYPDLYLNNHTRDPRLFLNQGDGTFLDKTLEILELPAFLVDHHGTAFADFDNDGDQDLLQLVGGGNAVGMGDRFSNQIFINYDGKLANEAFERGASYSLSRGYGTLWLDYNQDGLLDFVNGTLPRRDGNIAPTTVFEQDSDGSFFDASEITGYNPLDAFKFLYTDLSGDGILDLVTFLASGAIRVYDTSELPFLDITSEVLPQGTRGSPMVSGDFNGDLLPDLYIARGVPSVGGNNVYISDIYQNDTNAASARLVNNGPESKEIGFQFIAPEDVSIKLEWGQGGQYGKDFPAALKSSEIYIGAQGWNPSGSEFTLSSSDPEVEGISPERVEEDRRAYIGYDPDLKRWQILFSSTGDRPKALLAKIEASDFISDLAPIGFGPYPRPANHTLLLSSSEGLVDSSDFSGVNSIPIEATNVVAGDFDNDMDLDLYITTSRSAVNSPNILLENQGDGSFLPHLDAWGAAGTESGQSDFVITADYNLDGFLDLLVANGRRFSDIVRGEGPYQLFRNEGNDNKWVLFDLQGRQSNRDGIGAQVFITAGGVTQLREQTGGIRNFEQDHQRLHFGLADNTLIDELEIRWPSGRIQRISNLPANRLYRVIEVAGNEGERISGTPFDDIVSGGTGSDILMASAGDDYLIGGPGNDWYVFNADRPLGHNIIIEADDGGIDTLFFRRTTTRSITIDLSITTPQVVNDNLSLTLSSGTAFERVMGGAGDDLIIGNSLSNTLDGGPGNDTIIGGAGSNRLIGGPGTNTFRYGSLTDSLLPARSRDRILDLKIGRDFIDGPNAVEAADVVQAGEVAGLNASAVAAVLTADTFSANGAATFTLGSRTFLGLNDSRDGFQTASDAIIEITGYTGNLSDLAII